jgi:hypothetical protein
MSRHGGSAGEGGVGGLRLLVRGPSEGSPTCQSWSYQSEYQLTSLHSVLVRREYFSGNFSLHFLHTRIANTWDQLRHLGEAAAYLVKDTIYLERITFLTTWRRVRCDC